MFFYFIMILLLFYFILFFRLWMASTPKPESFQTACLWDYHATIEKRPSPITRVRGVSSSSAISQSRSRRHIFFF